MEEQNKTDLNDFSEEFLPLWRSFRKCQNILIVSALIFFVCNVLKIALAQEIIWIWVALAIVWNCYFYFKLRCPKCGNPLLGMLRSTLFIGRHCPSCGAILKKNGLNYSIHPWIPWDEKTPREKIIVISVLAIIAVLIVLAIMKGVEVKSVHIEVPKSNCR